MLRTIFPLVVGAQIQVPDGFAANCNYHGSRNFDPRWANLRPRVARLVFVENGPDGPLYGFQKKPAEGTKPAPSLVLFVPPLVGGETLEIEWVDKNCACARKVSPPV